MSDRSGRGMVLKRMYDRGHGTVGEVSWMLQLVLETCCAFATHVQHQPQAGALDLLPGTGSGGV